MSGGVHPALRKMLTQIPIGFCVNLSVSVSVSVYVSVSVSGSVNAPQRSILRYLVYLKRLERIKKDNGQGFYWRPTAYMPVDACLMPHPLHGSPPLSPHHHMDLFKLVHLGNSPLWEDMTDNITTYASGKDYLSNMEATCSWPRSQAMERAVWPV